MDILLLISALAPVAALLAYVRYRDRKRPEPWLKIIVGMLLGVVGVFVTQIMLNYILKPLSELSLFDVFFTGRFLNSFYKSFYLASIPEETIKLMGLWLLLKFNSDYDEVIDGIVYSVCIGLGFAGYENIIFLFNHADSWQTLSIVRCVFAVPGHYIYAIIMGFFFSLVWFYPQRYGKYRILVWVAPVMAHGIYDLICIYGTSKHFLLWTIYAALMIFSVLMHVLCLKYFKKLELMDQYNEDKKIFTDAMKKS